MPTFSKSALIRFFIGLSLTLCFTLLATAQSGPLALLEAKLYDFRLTLRGKLSPPPEVVIAAIDEKSIERLGRWPWNRDVLARLVDRLASVDASVIAFDIILSEHERNDPQLARAIDQAGNVILPVVFEFSGKNVSKISPALEQSAIVQVANPQRYNEYAPITASHILMPVPALSSSAVSLGHINMFPDKDGTLRWESLLIAYNDALLPSMPLLAAARHRGLGADRILVDAGRSITVGSAVIPTNQFGRTLINYYGPSQTFRHISISDILDNKIAPEQLANRIVLVGATAIGIYDLRVTPFSAAMPGVEKHASVIASILDNRFLRQIDKRTDLTAILLSGLILSLLLARLRLVKATTATITMATLYTLLALLLFTRYGIWINLSCPLLNIIAIFTSVTAYNYWAEERFSREIRSMFSSYVTARVVNELIKNPQMAKLGGERREVSVLFSDIKNFTSFSEKHSPTEVVTVLNEYLGAMTEVIFAWEGTLDKFVGDEIMVFWGAPMRQGEHAELAVRCALDMQKRLGELQAKWSAEGKPALEAGIGINSGDVLVGNIGAEGKKMDYTVIGDNVNLGARVEAMTRHVQRPLLLTEYTLAYLRSAITNGSLKGIHFEGMGQVTVKGKEHPVALYSAAPLADDQAVATISESEDQQITVMTEK